jgi:hypothetical protein
VIRLRKADGTEVRLDRDVAMIEVLSAEGDLGALLALEDGGVTIYTDEDHEFQAYCRALRLRPAKNIKHS